MHEHKIGMGGNACSVCENRRQESDITVCNAKYSYCLTTYWVQLGFIPWPSSKAEWLAHCRVFNKPKTRPIGSSDRATAFDIGLNPLPWHTTGLKIC